MSELIEAVGAALADRYQLSPRSVGNEPAEPITDSEGLRLRMERITRKFRAKKGQPSVRRRAAEAAGVPYSTWNHALAGRPVSKKNLSKIADAFRLLVTAPALALVVKKRGLPATWEIKSVVVCQPSGSRYINGRPAGTSLEDIDDATTGPEYRSFLAEGLDSGRIVGDWTTGGAVAATVALLAEIEDVYGDEFGFEGDNVEVTLHD